MTDILEKIADWKKHPDDYWVWDLLEEAADEIERLRSIVYQYRDDLQHPPSADSMQRRLKMIDDAMEGK